MPFHGIVRSKVRTAFRLAALFVFIMIGGGVGINRYFLSLAQGRVFHQVSDVRAREFGLVMGTDVMRFNLLPIINGL
jgi:vancomycin permeability regulator SanA